MSKRFKTPDFDERSLLAGLQVHLATGREKRTWWRLARKHHDLKGTTLVGEQLYYVVTDAQGTWVALLAWSAAVLHLKARDESIEWSASQREGRLHWLAQNSRLVILADRQRFPNLASRAMSLCLKRLSMDWRQAYGHPILLVESFVDRQLFGATAYQASGWEPLGYSSGFKRVNEDFYTRHGRPKQLWVKALDSRAWNWLRARRLPPHLARYEKPTTPVCTTPTVHLRSLVERFATVPDWRQPIGKRHRLPTVLAIVALAALAGVGQGYRAVSRFAQRLTQWQRRELKCWLHPDTARAHVPSEAVFQRVLQTVSRRDLEPIAIQWQNQTLGEAPPTDAVVIDGKEVRGGKLMLVNAVAQPSQRLLGVESVARKTNEIPTARTLIQRLELRGKLVPLDGMHTQHQTVHQLLYEKGADYSLILRDNQPTLLETAQTLLPADTPPSTGEDLEAWGTPGVPGDRDPDD
jgi:hypothetical protein